MIVMPVVAVSVIVMGRVSVSCAVPVMTMGVIHFVAARIACMGAKQRHRARNERADQRQENDCLNHGVILSRRMIWSENRCPPAGSLPEGMLFGIMR